MIYVRDGFFDTKSRIELIFGVVGLIAEMNLMFVVHNDVWKLAFFFLIM